MNYSSNLLRGFTLHSIDGEIGRVTDLYFDDLAWVVRYLVVQTGTWLQSRKVLISTPHLGHMDLERKQIQVDLTMDQVRNSPDIDTELPVGRQHEEMLHRYYGWPFYWDSMSGLPGDFEVWMPVPEGLRTSGPKGDPHLRSTSEVAGYHMHALDGNIGHIEDFIIEDESWRIVYLVAKTRDWLPGRHILIETEGIQEISWENLEVLVQHSCEEIRKCPDLIR